jgi:putative phosphoesterase
MKLAIISDIHANLPALAAVLKDIQTKQVDAIYCLGDLVNFAGWDNEVVELIKGRNIPCLQGNHDAGIGLHLADFPFSFRTDDQKEFGYASIKKVNKRISAENRKYLSELPFMLQAEFRSGSGSLKLAMVHGSTRSNNEYVQKNATDEYLLQLLQEANTQVLIMGHTHIPYYKKISNGIFQYHVINAGSVGKPKHGDNKSCYCLLTINQSPDEEKPFSVHVAFEFVPYEVEKVIRHLKELNMSGAYDDFLLKGAQERNEKKFETI